MVVVKDQLLAPLCYIIESKLIGRIDLCHWTEPFACSRDLMGAQKTHGTAQQHKKWRRRDGSKIGPNVIIIMIQDWETVKSY